MNDVEVVRHGCVYFHHVPSDPGRAQFVLTTESEHLTRMDLSVSLKIIGQLMPNDRHINANVNQSWEQERKKMSCPDISKLGTVNGK
jgi:hypothetical protein